MMRAINYWLLFLYNAKAENTFVVAVGVRVEIVLWSIWLAHVNSGAVLKLFKYGGNLHLKASMPSVYSIILTFRP